MQQRDAQRLAEAFEKALVSTRHVLLREPYPHFILQQTTKKFIILTKDGHIISCELYFYINTAHVCF